MSTPLVTVITPSFNRAAFLPETIESVLGQTYPNFEYLVLDDGSTDNTREVLAKYSGRLHWETHANMGEAKTVNRGFALAHGDLIAVVNSDDPVLPGFLEQVTGFLDSNPEVLATYPDWYTIDSGSRRFGVVYQRDFDLVRMLTEGICLVGPGAVFRRSALTLVPGRDPEYHFVGDYAFWLALGLRGKLARLPRTLATHRVHDDSATVKQRGTAIAHERARVIERFFEQQDLPDWITAIKGRALGTAYYMAGAQALHESMSEGRSYFLRSFHTAPADFVRHPKRLANLISLYLPRRIRTLLLEAGGHARDSEGQYGKLR